MDFSKWDTFAPSNEDENLICKDLKFHNSCAEGLPRDPSFTLCKNTSEKVFFLLWLASENSQHFATPFNKFPLEMIVWGTSADILYWWRVSTQIWVVLLFGSAAREICFNQSEALSRTGQWHVTCVKFLPSSLQSSFHGETSSFV